MASLKNSIAYLQHIANNECYKTIVLRSVMNIELSEFLVMPNHIHGIIIFGINEFNSTSNNENSNKFVSQSKKLASIIHGYKSAVTTNAQKKQY